MFRQTILAIGTLLSCASAEPLATITEKVFFDVQIGEKTGVSWKKGESKGNDDGGRITFGLYGDVVPKTVENFSKLCTGEEGVGTMGKPLTFENTPFHRIITGFMAQGGDNT